MLLLLVVLLGKGAAEVHELNFQAEVLHLNNLWADQMVEAGVMEESERIYYFRSYDHWDAATNWANHLADQERMMERMRLLRPDAPPVEYCNLLPSQEVIFQNRMYCRRFIDFLDYGKLWVSPVHHPVWDQAKADTQWRFKVWDLIADLKCNYGHKGRRVLGQELMDLLGEKDFYNVNLPDPVPPCAYNSHWNPNKDWYP